MSSTDSARQQLRQRRLRLQRQRQTTQKTSASTLSPRTSPSRFSPTSSSKRRDEEEDAEDQLHIPRVPSSLLKKQRQDITSRRASPSRNPRRNNNSRSNNDHNHNHNDEPTLHDHSTSQYETKYSPARAPTVPAVRRSWNEGQKSQAPSPSETQMWRSDLSSSKEQEPVGKVDVKEDKEEEDKEEDDKEEDDAQIEEMFTYLDGQLDELDVSGVCDTPVAEHSNTTNNQNDSDHEDSAKEDAKEDQKSDDSEGSDTDTEHDIEQYSSPSAHHTYGLRRQDLERHESKTQHDGTTTTTTTTTTTPQRNKPPQEGIDPLDSLLDLLEQTDADTSSVRNVNQAPSSTQEWKDTDSVISGLSAAPSLARSHYSLAPSMAMSMASSSLLSNDGGGHGGPGPMSKVYSNMKLKMTGLTMEVEDKSKTLKMLKNLLRDARQAHRDSEEAMASKEANKLKQVRSEYESTIARHLGFIDRLLADKQSLSDKCDALADEMKRLETRYATRAMDVQAGHVSELKRQKEVLAAGERARRERWTQDKKREIKASTLKGLEPELQRILSKHKNELRSMEDGHLKQVRMLEIKLEKEKDSQRKKIKENMANEKNEAVQVEIDIARSKLREQATKHEQELGAMRERYEKDTYSRTERDENTMKKMSERQADELEKVRVMERERREDQSRRFADEKMDLIRLHDNNMNHFKTREEEERIEYKKKLMVENQQQKEIEMEQFKSKMMQERDEQIDLVIRKLDEETGQASRAAASNFQNQMHAMKHEYEKEKKALRNSETAWMDKCTHVIQTKESLSGRLEMMTRKYADNERLKEELELKVISGKQEIHTACARMKKEHQAARFEDVKRQEHLEKLIVQLERKLESTNDETAILIGEERSRRSNELDQVQIRVRQTIGRKDEIIASLQEELNLSRMQTEHATEMLEKQRQELLA